jgi:hypothetical protein
VLPILEGVGLRAATVEDYGHWINREKDELVKQEICNRIQK